MGVLLEKPARLLAIAVAVLGAATLACAGGAAAQPFSTGTVTSPSSGSLGIPVTATVSSSCVFNGTGPTGTYNVPNLNLAFTNDFDFSVGCTSAFRVGVVSTNGALVAPSGALPSGYTNAAPYNVGLDLKGDTLDSGLVTCAASTLTASTGSPCTQFRGPASGSVGLLLNGPSSSTNNTSLLRVSAPAYSGANALIASNAYIDTLTVTLSPAT